MKKLFLLTVFLFVITDMTFAQSNSIKIQKSADGFTLLVNNEPFMVNGMNWDYFPRGTNFSYSLWNQPEDIIRAALDEEMSLLKNMGVNAIRQYTGVPAKWISYIYENYGI